MHLDPLLKNVAQGLAEHLHMSPTWIGHLAAQQLVAHNNNDGRGATRRQARGLVECKVSVVTVIGGHVNDPTPLWIYGVVGGLAGNGLPVRWQVIM